MDDSMRRAAAHYMAAAVLELFPDALLVGGSPTAIGFYYDFNFPFPFQDSISPLIEERYRTLVKEKRPFSAMEMVPQSAQAFLEHRGYRGSREKIYQGASLVSLMTIGEFVDVVEGELAAPCKIVKILRHCSRNGKTRLWVGTFSQEKELKSFIKTWQYMPHKTLGEEQNLFRQNEKGHWIWCPRGEKLRQILHDLWREKLLKQNFHFISTSPILSEEERVHAWAHLFTDHPLRLAQWLQTPSEGEKDPFGDLLDPSFMTTSREMNFCFASHLLQECISSLQFLIEIFKMLRFGLQFSLIEGKGQVSAIETALKECSLPYSRQKGSGLSRLEACVNDGVGLSWLVATMQIRCLEKERYVVQRISYVSLERIIALLLETQGGEIPFRFVPEQVRIFSLSQEEKGEKLRADLCAQGVRAECDKTEDKLSKRMHLALRERVPYCIVIGEKELRSEMFAVRAARLGTEEKWSLPMLIEQLRRELQVES